MLTPSPSFPPPLLAPDSCTVPGMASGRCVRWFLVINGFKTAVVAIDLFADDPRTQGVAALVFVFGMIAATLCVKPYAKRESNMLEAKLFVVVSARSLKTYAIQTFTR